MAREQLMTAGAMLVAIDIAKARNEVLIEAPGHDRRRRLTVPNTRDEHDRFVELLRTAGRPVIVALEATGNYHRPLAWRLLDAGFEVRLVSSVALARTREAIHNGWDKNDPKDAQVILHMLRTGLTQRYHDALFHGMNDLQELSKTHEAISKAKTEVLHRLLTHYLPLYFPEIDRFRHNSRSEWFFAFLSRFPTPSSITALEKAAFIAEAWDVVGRKVAKARLLADIYDTAASSIALPIPPDAEAIAMFRLVIAEVLGLIRTRDRIEGRAQALLGSNPDYQRLLQIPRYRTHSGAHHPCRGGRFTPLRSSQAVSEVLRPRPGDVSVWQVPWPDQAVEVRQRATASSNVAGCSGSDPTEGEQLSGQVRA